MSEDVTQDQESFLLEAWESLAAIEDALAGWQASASERPRGDLEVVCHRLRGSAALYGWMNLAAVAERLERLVHRHPAAALDRQGSFLSLFEEAMVVLPAVLERISADDSDSLPELHALGTRLDTKLESIDQDIRRFRDEHAELAEPFAFEAEELWSGLAEALVRLERSPQDLGALDDIFRRVHTLKGAALMVGCQPIGDVAHRAEDLLVGYQRRRQPLPQSGLAALDEASRALRAMLDLLAGADISALTLYRDATAALAAVPAAAPLGGPEGKTSGEAPVAPADELDARPAGRLIRVERERLDSLLDLVGDLVVARNAIERQLDQLGRIGEQMDWSRRRMLDTVSRFSDKYLNPTLAEAPPEPTETVGATAVGATAVGATAVGATAVGATGPAQGFDGFDEFGELELDRYDDFNVLARHVTEMSDDFSLVHRDLDATLGDLRTGSAHLQKLIRSARGEIARTRLSSIGPLFARLHRLVGEVAEETEKLVEVQLVGQDVEADGALIDRLGEPLMHLLQNAVIHGIEAPWARLEAAKSPRGYIALRAAVHGSSLRLEIEDDGAGIDAGRLREVALSQRLVTPEQIEALGEAALGEAALGEAAPGEAALGEAALGADRATELIFIPGLSTHDRVTRRAGRGVGMDVVRNAVSRLDGDIEASTELGRGTRFTLTLPATLVHSEALIVRVGQELYAVPLPAVKRVVALGAEDLPERQGLVHADGVEHELRYLSRILGRRPDAPAVETPVLLLQVGGRRLALAVDQVEGIAEVAVRPFDELLEDVELFAGGIVMPDGGLVLLLDSATLVALPEPEQITAATADARPAEESRTGSPRILLVDDSISVRKVLCRTLERSGFTVATAADGLEALEVLRDRTFDAVVTDLEMPRLNGYELIEDLRRRYSPMRLPIVVITTRASLKHAERARAMGASAYLYKPVDERRLVTLLREGIGHPPGALGSPGGAPWSGEPGEELSTWA